MKQSYSAYINRLNDELDKVNLSLSVILYSFSPLKAYEYGVSAVCLANWIHGLGQTDNLSPAAKIYTLNGLIDHCSPAALYEEAEAEGFDD